MIETIANNLQYFLTPAIAQVFRPTENTFEFSDIDRDKIICIAMPQKFQTERRYVNIFGKMLFYTHVLRRFDKPKNESKNDNPLILWTDEAQRFVTASEVDMSDYNFVDVIREARATLVAAAQSLSSFIPPLGREKARVLTLNLRNRMIFRAAHEEGANESANSLGKKNVIKKLWGHSGGRQSTIFFRVGVAQNKAACALKSSQAHRRLGPLRARLQTCATSTVGPGWKSIDLVPWLNPGICTGVGAIGFKESTLV